MKYYQVWDQTKQILKQTVSEINYNNYIKDSVAVDIFKNKILIANTLIYKSTANDVLILKIKEALKKVNPEICDVEFLVIDS